MRYSDHFHCVCGERYIINIPMTWALANPLIFDVLVAKHNNIKAYHWFCAWKSEVKAFLKQPVIIQVNR